MQVITGKYRGRKLISLDTEKTRPTLARVKESIFSMIDSYIDNSVVLDLFAGSGSLGIECVSRGAKKVYFVDANKDAKRILEKNLNNVKEDFEIVIEDYLVALTMFAKKGIKFDMVLLDPPYASDFGVVAINKLHELKLLNSGSLIIYEQEGKNLLQNFGDRYIIKKSKQYGIAGVVILEYVEE